ncbi:hypothetical protein H4R19_001651 [Coemansia spiralis]|nr:hypothetical protein H4R19_001651 [Coemansia spiralis]
MQRGVHNLTATEQAWATQQVANIIGAAPEDAAPLAAFLSGIGDPNELQSQLLDMLGESPLALDFALALIAKRFPAVQAPPSLPPRASPGAVAGGAVQEPAKSQRQLKRERQQHTREQRERDERQRLLATRPRVRCECQAAEHALFTNCLGCGRIICESEGPGPCMFCGNEVESPDQQLQLHMRRQLQRSEPQPAPKPAPAASSSNRMMATRQLLWSEAEQTPAPSSSASSTTCVPEDPSEEECMGRALRALGITADAADDESRRAAEAWAAATQRKDRLLRFDRTAAQRTRLIDQSADFNPDAVDKWMSAEERAAAERRQRDRAEADAKRDARLQSGVRVLRLNLAQGSADLCRPPDSDDETGDARPPPAAKLAQSQPTPQSRAAPQSRPTQRPTAPTFVPAVAKKAQRAARKGAASGECSAGADARRQQLRVQLDDVTAP